MQRFDEQHLREELNRLSEDGRAAFAAACAQRMLQGLTGAAAETGSEANTLLDRLWHHLVAEPTPRAELAELARRAETLLPDTEAADQWTPEDALAENAFAAVAYALHTAATGSTQAAVWGARQVIEALDLHTSERLAVRSYDEPAERAIASDPLLQAELRRQAADIHEITRIHRQDPAGFSRIRDRAQQDATALFGA